MRSLAVCSLTILLVVPALQAQTTTQTETQPALSEKVDVNAVLLDTIITDSGGNAILGLTKDDFLVTEDGKEQSVDSADYYTSRRLLSSTEENAPFNVERVHEERFIVFFFDKPSDGELFSRIALARSAASEFFDKHMVDGDRIAIVGHDVRLKIYSDFTSDKAQLRRALDDAARFGKGITKRPASGASPILQNIDLHAMVNRTGTTYEALTELSDALKPIRGRKNLILFSPGIHDPSEEVRGGVLLNRSRYYESTINALNAADVTIYAMNLQADAPAAPLFHQTLESLAQETNGDYFRYAVSYSTPLNSVAKATAGYYLLTYRTQKSGRGFQKVRVTVRNHPEFRVAARAGYSYGD